ncbi:MAG TPA: L,D-transpeptidase family protein [Patescibacteria group bacterium]|nr:L,D-transpeptidase family protein [Patescibacteria group bacterium]
MKYKEVFFVFTLSFLFAFSASAATDADKDRVSDDDEKNVYYTNFNNPDTDGDGFGDYSEIINGYSPHEKGKKMTETDFDKDNLNDRLERLLGTDLGNPDTDGDGILDGEEIFSGYDPRDKTKGARLKGKRIQIGIKEQKLRISTGRVILGEYLVSTGVLSAPTPLGSFKVDNKTPRAWSARWKLWMPWWMSLRHGSFGIHELPEWPNGKKEGERSIGRRASHGCVRLGVDYAKSIYDWTDLGTPVQIQESLY